MHAVPEAIEMSIASAAALRSMWPLGDVPSRGVNSQP